MIIFTNCRDHEMLAKISAVCSFIEQTWPRFSRLADYVFLADKPPVGWNFKCSSHPRVACHVAMRRGIRGVWARWRFYDAYLWRPGRGRKATYQLASSGDILHSIVHQMCHLYDARHCDHDLFMKKAERHGKFLGKVDEHAFRLAGIAWNRFLKNEREEAQNGAER